MGTPRITYTPQAAEATSADQVIKLAPTKHMRSIGFTISASELEPDRYISYAIVRACHGVKPNNKVRVVMTREQAALYAAAETALRDTRRDVRAEGIILSGYEMDCRAGALLRERLAPVAVAPVAPVEVAPVAPLREAACPNCGARVADDWTGKRCWNCYDAAEVATATVNGRPCRPCAHCGRCANPGLRATLCTACWRQTATSARRAYRIAR
jgi:hypothetical protein